jgi:hypothetical protein
MSGNGAIEKLKKALYQVLHPWDSKVWGPKDTKGKKLCHLHSYLGRFIWNASFDFPSSGFGQFLLE